MLIVLSSDGAIAPSTDARYVVTAANLQAEQPGSGDDRRA
jgi:hypothetical protein